MAEEYQDEDETGNVLLNSLRKETEMKEFENMNLKMEIDYLRERLAEHVGGNTTALELSAENFVLKKDMNQLESNYQKLVEKLKQLEDQYQKAMGNLLKMDSARKEALKKVECQSEKIRQGVLDKKDVEDKLQRLQAEKEQTEAMLRESLMLSQQIATKLEKDFHASTERLEQMVCELDQTRLELCETKTHLDQLQESQIESGAKNDQACAELKQSLQRSNEECAILRGETKALSQEMQALSEKYQSLQEASEQDKQKLITFMEENASLKIQIASSRQSLERNDKEYTFYTTEITRLQQEVQSKEKENQQLKESNYQSKQSFQYLHKKIADMDHQRDLSMTQQHMELTNDFALERNELEEKILLLQKNIDNLQSEKNALLEHLQHVAQLYEMDSAKDGQCKDVADFVSHMTSTWNELVQLRQKVELLRSKIQAQDNMKVKVADLKAKNAQLEEQLQTSKERIQRIVNRKNKNALGVIQLSVQNENEDPIMKKAKLSSHTTSDDTVIKPKKVVLQSISTNEAAKRQREDGNSQELILTKQANVVEVKKVTRNKSVVVQSRYLSSSR